MAFRYSTEVRFIHEGDELPASRPWLPTNMVQAKDPITDPDNPSLITAYSLVTVQGTWIVRPGERLIFPRRTNGEVIDWKIPLPPAMEIYPGDTLPHFSPEKEDEHGRIMVDSIQSAKQYDKKFVYINTHTMFTHTHFRWLVHLDQEFQFNPSLADMNRDRTKKYGPYVLLEDERVVYWLLVHPSGRGRWPSGIPAFEKIREPGVYVTRPPNYPTKVLNQWELLAYRGPGLNTDRHPNDPEISRMRRSMDWHNKYSDEPQ